MKVLQNISLDFGRDTIPITVFAKQYDKESRVINVTPLNHGQPYELESGIIARLQLTKPDNHTVVDDATIKDGIITVELSEQALVKDGTATAEIGLYKGTALLSSQIFYIDVKKSAYNPDAPVSSDEYNSLIAALQQAENETAAANTAAEAANAAATAADNAKAAAETATEGAENVNISVTDNTASIDITITDRRGAEKTVQIEKPYIFDTWDKIQNAVRMGLAPKYFPVGYEFAVANSDTNKNIVWVVRGYDTIKPVQNGLTHSMILEAKYLYSGADGAYIPIQFDAPEALYTAYEELAAGSYKITIAGSTAASENGNTYGFNLTKPIPAGGYIFIDSAAITNGSTISTYAKIGDTEALETVTVYNVSADDTLITSLGTTDGMDLLNHISRCYRGSNNYAQSAVRQWLNSAAVAGSVWQPTTNYDLPPTWANELNGFMHGLPEDFLKVIVPAIIPCRTNGVFETVSLDGTEFYPNELYELEDKFFMLSRGEIYGTYDNDELPDGKFLDYYYDLTTAEKKKFDDGGTARDAWLRSPSPATASTERIVHARTGKIYNSTASLSFGVAPACIIG